MGNLWRAVKSEYKNNKPVEPFAVWFLSLGIIIQLVTYAFYDGLLSMISGVAGVVAVILTSRKQLSAYPFAFLQLGTYCILALRQRFYGELMENAFYFVTMIFGLFMWAKHYNHKEGEVISRELGKTGNLVLGLFCILGILGLYWELNKTNDTQPLLDSISTVPAFIAQILMILRYREQWIYWLIIDIASIIMWWNAGNYCMVAQFIFWTANCIYGWKLWKNTQQ